MKKAKIEIGQQVGVTQKGEPWLFESWKSPCSSCPDSLCEQNIWIVDSIKYDYIALKQLIDNDTAYIFDTITESDVENGFSFNEGWLWVDEILSPDGDYNKDKYIFKLPIAWNRKTIPIDSIQSFSFAKENSCVGSFDLGLVLMSGALIVGAPITAFEDGSFNVATLIIGESIGLLLASAMYHNYKSRQISRYLTDEWQLKIK
ncbi:MAG: hypothetical protein LAT76_13370 [Schleiferiaceae bacterium]|nr:hypothetical protein [Schleiferiaceae bacterium]